MRIVGTAGHVDHGKSALVEALTGHNPDRLAEEIERGMTLDLGFAHLQFSDGVEAGIIDVPGHERFLHNMLAGAAGFDLLLLVIDALEGPRAQTREHLRILSLLNVRSTIVVLTKIDLATSDQIGRAEALAREACAGTVADGARMMAVSSVSRAGLDALRQAMHDALAALAPPPADSPAFMPVDRVFALPGRGTIVTGTLVQGAVRTGDAMLLAPSGTSVRVKSLQVFGKTVDIATAGSRVAANLPGVSVESVHRGDVLAAKGEFEPSDAFRVEFRPLDDAIALLRRRTPVRVHLGSAEIIGALIFDESPKRIGAWPSAARLQLSQRTIAYRGARFIVRGLSPKRLVGGGVIVSTAGAPSAAPRDDGDESVAEICARILETSGLTPRTIAEVAGAANLTTARAKRSLSELVGAGGAVALERPAAFVSAPAYEGALASARSLLERCHRESPWRSGCTTAQIAAAMGVDEATSARYLRAWHRDRVVGRLGAYWRLPDFAAHLTAEQSEFFKRALEADGAAGLAPASFEMLERQTRSCTVNGASEALETLLSSGSLVRVGDDLYRRGQIARVRSLLADLNRRNPEGVTMAQVRDAIGTSRKHALPLMEYFDSIGATVRDGDLRRLVNDQFPLKNVAVEQFPLKNVAVDIHVDR